MLRQWLFSQQQQQSTCTLNINFNNSTELYFTAGIYCLHGKPTTVCNFTSVKLTKVKFYPEVKSELIFFNWNLFHERLTSHYKAWGCKDNKKRMKSIQVSIPRLKSFKYQVKGKHSVGGEFQSLAGQRKKLLIYIYITLSHGGRKIMEPIRVTSRPPTRERASEGPTGNQEHSPEVVLVFHARSYRKFIVIKSKLKRKKLHRTN